MSRLISSKYSQRKKIDLSKISPIERYKMIFNNKTYGVLCYDPSGNKFSMRLRRNTPQAIRPSIIYGSVVMPETLKPDGYRPTSEEIFNWIKARSIPSNRQNIGDFLKENDLDHYDPWGIVKKNKGRCISDRWELYEIADTGRRG